MVEHDHRFAAGTQYTMDLAHGCGGVRRVMQHAVRVDDIERVVWEISRSASATRKVPGRSKQFKAPSCQINGGVGEIDTVYFAPALAN